MHKPVTHGMVTRRNKHQRPPTRQKTDESLGIGIAKATLTTPLTEMILSPPLQESLAV